jgi:hypothetical protein
MAVALADLEDRHDARVIEPCGGFGLAAKPRQIGRRRQIPSQEHLDRHGAAQALLQGAVDHAHATAADLLEEFIVAEGGRQRRDARQQTCASRGP